MFEWKEGRLEEREREIKQGCSLHTLILIVVHTRPGSPLQ